VLLHTVRFFCCLKLRRNGRISKIKVFKLIRYVFATFCKQNHAFFATFCNINSTTKKNYFLLTNSPRRLNLPISAQLKTINSKLLSSTAPAHSEFRIPNSEFLTYHIPNFLNRSPLCDFSSDCRMALRFSGLYQKNMRFCSCFSLGWRATNTFSMVAGL